MDNRKLVAIFVGTRPEAIKLAPVIRAISNSSKLAPMVVSTGQHREMLRQVTDQFGIEIDIEFDVMVPGQTLAGLSGRLLPLIDKFLEAHCPDFALGQGDTTTVLMSALGCFYRNVPFGHVEAGLRTDSIRSPFPEEANRRLVTPLASLHFAPTETSKVNLLAERVASDSVYVTGNTVIDALHIEQHQQLSQEVLASFEPSLRDAVGFDFQTETFVLITGHRRENFGHGFAEICRAIKELAEAFPKVFFVYPVHLNPQVQQPVFETLSDLSNVRLVPPQSYREFVRLMCCCHLILTDSGGVQEEAPSLGKPVLVMRDSTERPEGVQAGTVKLVGAGCKSIVESVSQLLIDQGLYETMARAENPYGDGQSSRRIVEGIESFLDV